MLNIQEAEKMARKNILPFWQQLTDTENGGFYGHADFYGKPDKEAGKGGILHSRILWTFSAAYRLFKDSSYLDSAAHAYSFIKNSLFDKEHGGLYWLVDYKGRAEDTRKQFYNLAFGIYALSEYSIASGNKEPLDLALELFETIEKYGFDPKAGGYIEACTRDWGSINDSRLSKKDLNCPKSMNTNLHVLEAYTNLLHATGNKKVHKALEALTNITLERIVNDKWNFELFFDMNWTSLVKDISYGHDIEGSWLLYEAALALKNDELTLKVKQAAIAIAEVTYNAAIDHKNGGLFSGCNAAGKIYSRKEWWPQAEAVVGFYNAYELTGDKKYLDTAVAIWDFASNHFMDNDNGEWHNELSLDNEPDTSMPKAGFWKCPYHNSRACFEVIRRMS